MFLRLVSEVDQVKVNQLCSLQDKIWAREESCVHAGRRTRFQRRRRRRKQAKPLVAGKEEEEEEKKDDCRGYYDESGWPSP